MRLREFLAGDPPAYPPGPAEARTIDVLGLRIPLHAAALLLGAIALLLVDRTHDFLPAYGPVDPRSLWDKAIERFVLFGIVPLLVLLALREDPRRYGLGVGDVRRGLPLLAVLMAVTVPAIVLVAAIPAFRDFYAPEYSTAPDVLLRNGLDLVATEFLLRGVVLFALLRAIVPLAVVVAVVPFAFMHLDKPEVEMLSTLGGGLVFGWLNWRTRSIWYSGIYHVAIQSTVVIAAAAWAGRAG
jgi:CAAX protease family protein